MFTHVLPLSDERKTYGLKSPDRCGLNTAKTVFSSCIEALSMLTRAFTGTPGNAAYLLHVCPSFSET